MKRLALFKELRRQRRLAEKRALSYQQNKTAKVVIYTTSSLVLTYLIFIAIMLSLGANNSTSVTQLEFIFGLAPLILLADFGFRFVAQQTPAQLVKPYVMLPIPKFACIDTFLGTSMLNRGNFIWFTLLIPYALMSLFFSYPIWTTLAFLLFWWLLIVANSQWYLICRTKISDSQLWWLLPIAVYTIIALPILLNLGKSKGWLKFFDFYAGIGTLLEDGNPLPFIGVIALLAVLLFINRTLQYSHVWKELAKVEITKLHNITRFSFLDQFGEVGEYLKLEMKTILRNKNPRKSFISTAVIGFIFVLVIVFTDIYNSDAASNFWCIYCFILLGTMNIVKVMCNEGNYLDGLMVHKENILSLLKAKYIFNCMMLVFPFLLMLPTVFSGKWDIAMLLSYGVFTAGFQFFLLFQLAVYNKQTIPLNEKFIAKGSVENNYFAVAASFAAFTFPMILVNILQNLLSKDMSYIVMFLIGLSFIATHRLWLRNIYNRLMKRRYINMESFRASR